MIEEEIEKQAKERAEKLEEKQTLGVYDNEEDLARDMGWNDGKVCGYEEGFIAGAKWGMEHAIEWHDLRKNPDDLPKYKNSMTIRICWKNAYGNKCYHDAFYDDKGFYWISDKTCTKQYADRGVIAWCELPQFKE